MRKYTFRNSGQTYIGIPIMAANMDTVGTFEMAKILHKVSLRESCNCTSSLSFDIPLDSTRLLLASTSITLWKSGKLLELKILMSWKTLP